MFQAPDPTWGAQQTTSGPRLELSPLFPPPWTQKDQDDLLSDSEASEDTWETPPFFPGPRVKRPQPPSTLERLNDFGIKAGMTRHLTPGPSPEEVPHKAFGLPHCFLVPFCEEDLEEILGRHGFYASGTFPGPVFPALPEGAPPEGAPPVRLIRLKEEGGGQLEQGFA